VSSKPTKPAPGKTPDQAISTRALELVSGTPPTDLIEGAITPQPIVRIEWIRIVAPLAILGFMSSRMLHADDWLSSSGFRVPAMADDWRQPLAVAGLPSWAAWSVCAAMLVSGLMTSLGAFTRFASAVFASTLVYVALADRLAAFTVSKISPVIVLAICLSPAGARYSIDAWRARRRDPAHVLPTRVSWGNVRFFQVMLAVFYFASGIAKARGDWWSQNDVLWTHLHDSYQTTFSWLLANHLPAFSWTVFQKVTLAFEVLAPIWYLLRRTRPFALVWALGMHLMIGLMFGPVIWFSLLMMTLNIGAFAPIGLLQRLFDRVAGRFAAYSPRRT
jgi:uncharacterized membrane protein YphA (DoxX/SURF4 family)